MGMLRDLSQRDAVDLSWYFAEPYGSHTGSDLKAQSYEPQSGGAHPAVAAERRLERLVGVASTDRKYARIAATLWRAGHDAERYLMAAYDPQPESFDFYTRRDAGLLFTMMTARKEQIVASPGDPFFTPVEGALVRFTPTLTLRAIRQLADEQERRDTFVAYTEALAAGATPFEVIEAVNEAAERVASLWTPESSPRQVVEERVLEIVERTIATVRKASSAQARDDARAVLRRAKGEAAELHDFAADAYVRAREELFPKKRKPKPAPAAVAWSDPAAWTDAAE